MEACRHPSFQLIAFPGERAAVAAFPVTHTMTWVLCNAPSCPALPAGRHHTKAFLLKFATGMRVVVFTGTPGKSCMGLGWLERQQGGVGGPWGCGCAPAHAHHGDGQPEGALEPLATWHGTHLFDTHLPYRTGGQDELAAGRVVAGKHA